MYMPKTVNYTAELTQKIIDDYQNGSSVQTIAESIGKSLQSVRSKLVREGVYIAQEKKSKSNKPKEPTKKELLNVLENQVPFPVTGLLGATKDSIIDLIEFTRK